MEIPFAMALERGKTLKLADLNSGFTRPDTIALAYFEASLLVDHLVQTYGDAKLHALVQSYAQGLEGDAAVEKTVGVTIPELQASFDKALDARFGNLRAALRPLPGAAGRSEPRRRAASSGGGRRGFRGYRRASPYRRRTPRQLPCAACPRSGACRGWRSRGVRAAREGGRPRPRGHWRGQPACRDGAPG